MALSSFLPHGTEMSARLRDTFRAVSRANSKNARTILPKEGIIHLLSMQRSVEGLLTLGSIAWEVHRVHSEDFDLCKAEAALPPEKEGMIADAVTVAMFHTRSLQAYTELTKDAAKGDAIANKYEELLQLCEMKVLISQLHCPIEHSLLISHDYTRA